MPSIARAISKVPASQVASLSDIVKVIVHNGQLLFPSSYASCEGFGGYDVLPMYAMPQGATAPPAGQIGYYIADIPAPAASGQYAFVWKANAGLDADFSMAAANVQGDLVLKGTTFMFAIERQWLTGQPNLFLGFIQNTVGAGGLLYRGNQMLVGWPHTIPASQNIYDKGFRSTFNFNRTSVPSAYVNVLQGGDVNGTGSAWYTPVWIWNTSDSSPLRGGIGNILVQGVV